MMQSCTYCLADNPAAARHCRRCGRRLSAQVISTTPVTPLMQQWRRLKRDLTRQEVRMALGEPLRIDQPPATSGEELELWTYEYKGAMGGATVSGLVRFVAWEGRLVSWSEPEWRMLMNEATQDGATKGTDEK
jgi:hypothetical protein